jgi:hypothetical protein
MMIGPAGRGQCGMAQADPPSLQIQPDAADPALAGQQERFNVLVQDVALWRAALAEWNDRIDRYRQAVEPVRRELHAAWREWVFALDDASLRPGLSRAERQQLAELLQEAITPLLAEEDPEIAAVAAQHVQEPRRQDQADAADSDEQGQEDVAEDWEAQAAAAAAQRAEWAAKRRAASAANRRRKQEQEVSLSVRDVYRRLASTLHPDREPDARERERKTRLMQEANLAYAEQDLLALLELQLHAEQIDATHLRSADRKRLQHYVAVLEEQLSDLQSETRRLEATFREATGLPPGSGLQPRKADRMISSEAQRMRGDVQALRRQAKWLLDEEATKEWLRQHRKA